MAFYISLAAMLLGFVLHSWKLVLSLGLNKNIGWAWDITNFVWWVGGIGHAEH
jgi:molybdopterin-containing oxidoreductase family membrane subunit